MKTMKRMMLALSAFVLFGTANIRAQALQEETCSVQIVLENFREAGAHGYVIFLMSQLYDNTAEPIEFYKFLCPVSPGSFCSSHRPGYTAGWGYPWTYVGESKFVEYYNLPYGQYQVYAYEEFAYRHYDLVIELDSQHCQILVDVNDAGDPHDFNSSNLDFSYNKW